AFFVFLVSLYFTLIFLLICPAPRYISFPYTTLFRSELNKWRDKLVKYRRIKNYANRVFDYALRMDIIDSNPFDKVPVPKRIETIDDSEFENFYTKEELNEFLECVKEDLDLNWYTYFRILAY